MIKCIINELGQAGQENPFLEIMTCQICPVRPS